MQCEADRLFMQCEAARLFSMQCEAVRLACSVKLLGDSRQCNRSGIIGILVLALATV